MALLQERARRATTPTPGAVRLTKLGRMGADGCGDVELLAIATGSRLSQAAQLLERIGGMQGVSTATAHELIRAGLAPGRAAALAAACETARRGAAALPEGRWVVRSPGDLAERLLPGMGRLEREELRVATLNTKNVVTALVTVYVGNVAGSAVRVGEVFRDAVRRNAAAVLVVHNHPSGDPSPSGEDLRITAELAAAGRLLDIQLLDHLVIGRDRWVSLRATGAV
jgi:DNA repair protein RadC